MRRPQTQDDLSEGRRESRSAKELEREAGGWAGHLSQSREMRRAGMATPEPVSRLNPAPGAPGTWSSQQQGIHESSFSDEE